MDNYILLARVGTYLTVFIILSRQNERIFIVINFRRRDGRRSSPSYFLVPTMQCMACMNYCYLRFTVSRHFARY